MAEQRGHNPRVGGSITLFATKCWDQDDAEKAAGGQASE